MDSEFSGLLSDYERTLRYVAGCGASGQCYIDPAWNKLREFASQHPEFQARVPSKQQSDDDETGGRATGLVMAGGNNCSIL